MQNGDWITSTSWLKTSSRPVFFFSHAMDVLTDCARCGVVTESSHQAVTTFIYKALLVCGTREHLQILCFTKNCPYNLVYFWKIWAKSVDSCERDQVHCRSNSVNENWRWMREAWACLRKSNSFVQRFSYSHIYLWPILPWIECDKIKVNGSQWNKSVVDILTNTWWSAPISYIKENT